MLDREVGEHAWHCLGGSGHSRSHHGRYGHRQDQGVHEDHYYVTLGIRYNINYYNFYKTKKKKY